MEMRTPSFFLNSIFRSRRADRSRSAHNIESSTDAVGRVHAISVAQRERWLLQFSEGLSKGAIKHRMGSRCGELPTMMQRANVSNSAIRF
jgi:hypothetical protein